MSEKCPKCKGSGTVPANTTRYWRDCYEVVIEKTLCDHCNGTGANGKEADDE